MSLPWFKHDLTASSANATSNDLLGSGTILICTFHVSLVRTSVLWVVQLPLQPKDESSGRAEEFRRRAEYVAPPKRKASDLSN